MPSTSIFLRLRLANALLKPSLVPSSLAACGLAVCFAFCVTSSASATLVGEWTFDSQTLANTGSSGSVHDGTFQNSTGDSLYSTDTRSGSGFSLKLDSITSAPAGSLPGGEFLQINNTDSDVAGYQSTFDTASFTVSMWVKTDGTWSQWDEFAGKGSESNGDGWALRMRTQGTHSQDGARFNFYSDGSVARDDDPYDVDLLDQEWHLITATYDGTEMKLYLDEFLVANDSNATLSDNDAYSLVFGARDDGSRGEDILIDSIQFYDEALSATQVANLVSTVPEANSLLAIGLLATILGVRRSR